MKKDKRDIESNATNQIRELLGRSDVKVHSKSESMMGLYFGNRLIAYCFSHRVHQKNADIKYKIMLPKYIEINFTLCPFGINNMINS